LTTVTYPANSAAVDRAWYLDSIQVPENIVPPSVEKPIVIAIVDDGVRVSHEDIKALVWKNPREIAANRIDDDGNGFVDDVSGWDVSDQNNQAVPPIGRLSEYYHGTHLAGIVSRMATEAYGENAASLIRILPVKTLSDEAATAHLVDGFKGIEYAMKAGADIIVCAWVVAQISPGQSELLRKAQEMGILIVASAGNFPENRPQYPAAHPQVLAVTALDDNDQKIPQANYGSFVDIAAPGKAIYSAGSRTDMDYQSRDGTSQATAMIATAAAMVKLKHPSYSREKIIICLKQSSQLIPVGHPQLTARLGAGKLNVVNAINCDFFDEKKETDRRLKSTQGYLNLSTAQAHGSSTWDIKPASRFKGFKFTSSIRKGAAGDSILSFYNSTAANADPIVRYPLKQLPEEIYIAGTTARVVFEHKNQAKDFNWILAYRAEPIDFSAFYCDGTVRVDTEGTIEDGSSNKDYSFNSDCKWLITAPEGKVVDLKFVEFDTEAKTDWLYSFNGAGTHEDIIAMFSGPDIPPPLRSWNNQLLLWFVSNGDIQRRGWKAELRFIDP